MFHWVLNTPMFLDTFFCMALLVSMHKLLFQNVPKMQFQEYNVVQDFSFTKFLSLKLNIVFSFLDQRVFVPCVLGFCYWFQNTTFDVMGNCCRIVITSYNSIVLYKINTFIKKQDFMVQVEVNCRKIFKPLANVVFHIFLQKGPRIWLMHIHCFFVGSRLVLHSC